MSGIKIYVAGSSRHMARVRMAMEAAGRVLGADAITHDWTRAFGDHEPGHDEGVGDRAATSYAATDLLGIERADVFWLLASRESLGSWCEFGYALGLRQSTVRPSTLIVSGVSSRVSIFSRLADVLVETDMAAVDVLRQLARERSEAAE